MNIDLVNRISNFLSNIENNDFAGKPVDEVTINEAEKILNVSFDKDYKEFLTLFGGSFVGVPIYGFNNCEMLSNETVIDLTNDFRESYSVDNRFQVIQDSYVITIDGSGNPVIINKNGEIIIYYHGSDDEEVIATSFEELIENNFFE